MKKKLSLLVLFAIALCMGCYDDKGNYDYREINQISIQNIDSLVLCDQMDAMRIFTYDCVPSTKKLLDDGIITATICQQPYKQGYLPVELLSRYLIEGISCEEFHYTDIDIRIKENL